MQYVMFIPSFIPSAASDLYFVPTDEEVLNEEELDKELLWNLQLLSEVES